jgi:imidazolonepropionase-like amidohydrolase
MKKLLFITLVALALLTPERPVAQAQAAATGAVAIRGGTVLTVTQGTIPNGVVILRDGRIEAVGGSNTPIPPGAEIVEAGGASCPRDHRRALAHRRRVHQRGRDDGELDDRDRRRAQPDRHQHLSRSRGRPDRGQRAARQREPDWGTNAVIKLRWGKARAEELLFEGALPGIKFALGENPKDMRFGGGGQQNQPPRRYPATRPGVEYVIRDAFTRAKAYQREWQEYERARGAGGTPVPPIPPRRDLQLEPLVEILEGKRLVHAHCYRADEILMLIRLADEMGFKIATFQHVLEGFKVADEIAAHGAGASTFSDWWAYKVEAEDATPYNAALMHKRGVLVSINSDSAEHARRLNTEAAKSIHWGGLTDDEALALVTINPPGSCVSTTASDRSKPARTPMSSSGTTTP